MKQLFLTITALIVFYLWSLNSIMKTATMTINSQNYTMIEIAKNSYSAGCLTERFPQESRENQVIRCKVFAKHYSDQIKQIMGME
jgi:hypothetical protein